MRTNGRWGLTRTLRAPLFGLCLAAAVGCGAPSATSDGGGMTPGGGVGGGGATGGDTSGGGGSGGSGGTGGNTPLTDGGSGATDGGSGASDGGSGASDGSAPSTGCTAPMWPAGTETTVMLAQGTTQRSYQVHVGKSAAAGQPVPLLLNFHGLTNSPQIQEGFSGMNAIADAKGFIVVYPQGISASFNAGGCCGQAQQTNVDDLGFTRAIVADVEGKLCVDARRVYATGFSNGGYMSHTLGCEASDLLAAIAPVSGVNTDTHCTPAHPMPVIAFHGDSDPIVPYGDDQQSIADWVKRDGCGAMATRTSHGSSYCDVWTGCTGGVSVELCTIAGGSHAWPGNNAAIPASPAIWDFLSKYTLP